MEAEHETEEERQGLNGICFSTVRDLSILTVNIVLNEEFK